MPDYKAMYLQLFNRMTDAINVLQKGQREVERAFVEHDDEPAVFPLDVEKPTRE